MDFAWTDEQLAFKTRVVEFARDALRDDVAARDRDSRFDRALWQRCEQLYVGQRATRGPGV